MLTRQFILLTLKANELNLAKLGLRKVGLFGSFNQGVAHPESDVDLLIDFFDEKETYDNLIASTEFLERLFPGQKVNVITLNGLSPHIGPQIILDTVYA